MKTAVINLVSRIDRLREVTKQINHFLTTEFTVYPAHSEPDALRGNAFSHFDLLKQGFELIFEDDVFFESDFTHLQSILPELPTDYDILYLGGNVIQPIYRYSKNLHKCTDAWGSFAILYSEKGRNYVLNNYSPNATPFTIYDEWLRIQSKSGLKAFIPSVPIAWTRGGFSDVNKQVENYEPGMRANAAKNII